MALTSFTLNDLELDFGERKRQYDSLFNSAVSDGVECTRSEYTTFTYEKVPAENEVLAEEGLGSYQERKNTTYQYDIFAVTSSLIID